MRPTNFCAIALLLNTKLCSSFDVSVQRSIGVRRVGAPSSSLFSSSSANTDSPQKVAPLNPKAIELKNDLISLAQATRRGFSASRADREKAWQIVDGLSTFNPTKEPASAYYNENTSSSSTNINSSPPPSLAGKWTLIYTDAPDINSLDTTGNPFATAQLGRIGQECNPPSIKNVIEWKRPDWLPLSLPFSGGEGSRVLQKVCCEGSATLDEPAVVELKLVGLELEGDDDTTNNSNNNGDDRNNKLLNGPAGFLENFPVKLQGPLVAPFGKFEILYLDGTMRITRTHQGFTAVNVREDKESKWF
ncbi:predicted protein [Thalassiosira pseudonana CCMP1335]|uniref:Plastid lipid-associated protein/fibrillin conserved domain-containing protein n=1 Tax=Thalassiosira pseudonana TaxID=35128 RepID=B8C3Y8_THAPS|nr:predicted protein [Thalassiosira pseudonana CCMP1335]EED92207.1 predicted protein [Thalassiosira pseudonana CCMP1335]|eukprot:g14561.t1 g14561   contig9:2151791-2152702(+)